MTLSYERIIYMLDLSSLKDGFPHISPGLKTNSRYELILGWVRLIISNKVIIFIQG